MTASQKQRIAVLVRRINNAPDFGYDDEADELTALLTEHGKAWKWSGSIFSETVEIYTK